MHMTALPELGIPVERTGDIIGEYGYSSTASIPLGLSLAREAGNIQPGDVLPMTAMGAGMVEAGVVWRW